jgi:F-type H+-transporting ATPase subunit alpha
MKQVAGTLRLDLAGYREMQAFAQFGSDLDAATQRQLTHGARMTEVLKQGRYSALDVADQAIVLFAGKEGYLDDLRLEDVQPFRDQLVTVFNHDHDDLRDQVRAGKISGQLEESLRRLIDDFKADFVGEDE